MKTLPRLKFDTNNQDLNLTPKIKIGIYTKNVSLPLNLFGAAGSPPSRRQAALSLYLFANSASLSVCSFCKAA